MARMHSRKKGKSGSRKPLNRPKPTWITYKPDEIEKLVVKLAKQGLSQSYIGLVLRDSYGIPDTKALAGKKIGVILKEHSAARKLPEDIVALIKKDIKLMLHQENQKHDITVKRGIMLTESKINRLAKYYIANKVLPTDWKFDRTKAKLYLE